MEKNLDAKGRRRNRNVGFRVSEEEAKLLDNLVELSGLAKQDYILRRLLNREIVVQGNPKVFNTIIIGVAAKHMDFDHDKWVEVIKATVPPKTVEMNLKAFEVGYAL